MNWPALAAQCVMCFRTAAAQQGERSRAMNTGIVLLLVPPVLLLAGILYLAWRKSGDPGSKNKTAPNESSPPGAAA